MKEAPRTRGCCLARYNDCPRRGFTSQEFQTGSALPKALERRWGPFAFLVEVKLSRISERGTNCRDGNKIIMFKEWGQSFLLFVERGGGGGGGWVFGGLGFWGFGVETLLVEGHFPCPGSFSGHLKAPILCGFNLFFVWGRK